MNIFMLPFLSRPPRLKTIMTKRQNFMPSNHAAPIYLALHVNLLTVNKGPGDSRILFFKSESLLFVVHFGPKRCLYILWRPCLPVDVTRSSARNSCLNKCSLLSRPPVHEQIYNQEDFGLSHRHLFNIKWRSRQIKKGDEVNIRNQKKFEWKRWELF